MYDLNGDGELDEEEFSKVQDLVLSQSNVGQRHRNHVTGAGSFRKSKSSVITKYFFDPNRKEKLSIEKFLQFQVIYIFLATNFVLVTYFEIHTVYEKLFKSDFAVILRAVL